MVPPQAEGWSPQAFWALHRLARCRRALCVSARDKAKAGGAYVSTVMRLAAVLKDPRVRSEGGKAAVETATAALLRDARGRAGEPASSSPASSSPAFSSPEAAGVSGDASGSSHVAVATATGEGGRHVYRLQCFADTKLSIYARAGGEGRVRTRRLDPLPAVHVGDTLLVSCVLTSHLPEAVTLDALVLEMTLHGTSSSGGGGGGGGGWMAAGPNGSGQEGRGDRADHRRSASSIKTLRRLESVRTVVSGDGDLPLPSISSAAGSQFAAFSKLQPPPPVVTSANALGAASQALTSGVTGGTLQEADAAAAAARAALGYSDEDPDFPAPVIRAARSQSLSPRTSASSHGKGPLVRVPGGKPPRGGRSRSPMRHSMGPSPPTSPLRSTPAAGSRLPRARSRPACSARVEGPVQLLPGETEVTFSLRPTMPGIIVASRLSAAWGCVSLVEAFPLAGRRGAAALPSAWVGAPSPPPSAVVRPFRPRAALDILPPPFLPAGREGWVRVAVTAGPDTLRGARLKVTVGRGLSWGAVESARVSLRREDGGDGDGDGDGDAASPGAGTQAQARAGDNSSDVVVDLPDVLEAGRRVEVSLRVESTAAAASPVTVALRPCSVKAELQAWHSRPAAVGAAAGDADRGNAGASAASSPVPANDASGSEDWGVECQTRARSGISARVPFDARVAVIPRPGGVVLAEAALVSTAPVALVLRSCDVAMLEPGATVMADPNAFLQGEELPPGQPLRLAVCLKRGPVSSRGAPGESSRGSGSGPPTPPPLAVLRLRYAIVEPSVASGDSSGGNGSGLPAELFVFDVCIPRPSSRDGPGAAEGAAASSEFDLEGLSLTAVVEPCDRCGSGDLLHLTLAEPRAFEFGVDVNLGADGEKVVGAARGAAVPVTFQVVASPLDWMVSGLVRGTAGLKVEVNFLFCLLCLFCFFVVV